MKKFRLFSNVLAATALIFATTTTAEAFSLKNKLKDAAKRTVERNVDSAIRDAERAADRGIDKLEDKAVDAIVGNKDDNNTNQNTNNTTITSTNNNNLTSNSAASNNNNNVSKEEQKYVRHAADPQIDPDSYYDSQVRPREHANWDKTITNGRLKEHFGFLMARQATAMNEGDWETIAADFSKNSIELRKIYKEFLDRGEANAARYALENIHLLRRTQRNLLYPGIHVCDFRGYSSNWSTGNYDFSIPMTKYRYYEILDYYVQMAKRETSQLLKYTSTSEAIYWRADGVMNPGMFKEDPVMADDPEWIEAEKQMTELCKEVGINGLVSFEDITAYRKKLELKALEKEMKWNTANRIPKTSLSDPQAVAFAKKEFQTMYGNKVTIVKVYVKSGWNVATNSFGVPVNREKTMTIIAKHPDGIHRLHDCRLGSITSNGGGSWSNSMFSVDAVAGNREGYPVFWK